MDRTPKLFMACNYQHAANFIFLSFHNFASDLNGSALALLKFKDPVYCDENYFADL